MSDFCETVSAVLGLYAEGELHDPLAVELVREHILDCANCRETLEVYDDLTRTLLGGPGSLNRPLGDDGGPGSLRDGGLGSLRDGGPLGGDGWTDLERQRRVEGVLSRLKWQASTPSLGVSREAASSGSRVPQAAFPSSDGLERFAFLERSDRPRLDLSLDDLVDPDHASTSRRNSLSLGASGPRRFALAAAALLGIVSVWLAVVLSGMLSGSTSELARRVSRDALDSRSPVVASSGRYRNNREPPRRENDHSLRWVLSLAGAAPRPDSSPGSPGGARAPSDPELLAGVNDRPTTRSRSAEVILSSTPTEADTQWVVWVVILESPPERTEAHSGPRYLLVRDSDFELADPSRSVRPLDVGGLWFRPSRIERRPARKYSAPRLTVGTSNLYRVCVYEDIRRLELPVQSWTADPWRTPSTFRREPPGHLTPRLLPTFTENWLRPAVHPEQNRRY